MPLLPLTLVAKRGNWQRYTARKRNPKFEAIQKKILKRDNQTCLFCDFHCDRYHSILNLDHNYNHNQENNLASACSFCAQCLLLDGLGQSEDFGGYIIYLPEVSQADLNHFCRALFCSMLKEAPYKGKLQTTYLSLKDRTQPVDQLLGTGASDPKRFAQSLMDTNIDTTEINLNALIQHLRVLPMRKFFIDEIHYWKQTVFQNIPI